MTSASEIQALIQSGEGVNLEFKASFRIDLENGAVNRELPRVVAKTMAAFLNCSGGTLLIGVSDGGEVLGIDRDLASLKRPNRDGMEQAIRTTLGNYLGYETSPCVSVGFADIEARTVVRLDCEHHMAPVFFRDSDRQQFFVRDGNVSRPLDLRAAHEYIKNHWREDSPTPQEGYRAAMKEALAEVRSIAAAEVEARVAEVIGSRAYVPVARGEGMPPWLRVATRRVVDLFLRPLAGATGWKRLYIISPWISDITHNASMTFDQVVKRLRDDNATAYVVTRPPEEEWHDKAIKTLAATGRANIAFLPELHTKLYAAQTDQGTFAVLASANFTQQALNNRELGILVNGFEEGRAVVTKLNHEAAYIYRSHGRTLIHKATF
jgi:Putative DNA-binding domain